MALHQGTSEPRSLLWQHQAACRGPLGSVFFPPPTTERKREKLEREDKAKSICMTCPVINECRTHAIDIGESHGVWGGLSERERRALLEP